MYVRIIIWHNEGEGSVVSIFLFVEYPAGSPSCVCAFVLSLALLSSSSFPRGTWTLLYTYPQKVFWRTSHGHVVTAGFFPFAIILPGLPRVGRAQHAFPLPNDRILSTRAFARTYDMYQQYVHTCDDGQRKNHLVRNKPAEASDIVRTPAQSPVVTGGSLPLDLQSTYAIIQALRYFAHIFLGCYTQSQVKKGIFDWHVRIPCMPSPRWYTHGMVPLPYYHVLCTTKV